MEFWGQFEVSVDRVWLIQTLLPPPAWLTFATVKIAATTFCFSLEEKASWIWEASVSLSWRTDKHKISSANFMRVLVHWASLPRSSVRALRCAVMACGSKLKSSTPCMYRIFALSAMNVSHQRWKKIALKFISILINNQRFLQCRGCTTCQVNVKTPLYKAKSKYMSRLYGA